MLVHITSIQIWQWNRGMTCADITSIFHILTFNSKVVLWNYVKMCFMDQMSAHDVPRFQCLVFMLVSCEHKDLMELQN